MSRNVFLPAADLTAETVLIEGPDAHHLTSVLRVRVGDPLVLLDDRGGAVRAEVAEVGKRAVLARTIEPAEVAPEPPVRITVAQALGKGDKFEQVVQHATEVGASAFIPLVTERTVARLDARETESKRARWLAIAKGAAEQSGRARIPAIHQGIRLPDLASHFAEFGEAVMLHVEGQTGDRRQETGEGVQGSCLLSLVSCLLSPVSPSILLLVGPEGGFSATEVELARAAGARVAALGPYVLRTETAALVAVAQILYALAAQGDARERK